MAATVADLQIVVNAETKDAEQGLDNLNSRMKSTSGETAIASAGLIGFGGALANLTFVGPIQAAMDFEAVLTDAYIAVGEYQGGIQGLQNDIMSLAEALPFSAGEVAGLVEELGRLGVSSESIKDVAYNVMALAAGLGTDLVPTGQAVIKIINSLGLSMDSVGEISNSLFKILAAGTLDLGSFMSGWEKIGSLVKTAGMSFIDAAGFLTILTDAGVDAATAGTALAMLFGKLISPTEELKSMLSSLGIAFQDASGKMLPVTDIILNIMDAWKGLTQQQKIDLAKLIGGEDQFKYLITLFDQGREAFENFKKKYEQAMGLQDVIAQKMGTAKAAWDTFKETLANLQIIVGQKLLPAFKSIIGVVTEFIGAIQKVPSSILTVALVVAGAVAAFVTLAGVLGILSLAGGTFTATMGLLLSPVMLVVAAIAVLAAGLILAYNNIEGFRNAVDGVLNVLKKFGSYLKDVWKSGDTFSKSLSKLPAPLQTAARAIGIVVDAIRDLKNAFSAGGLKGLLAALPNELRQIGSAFKMLGGEILNGLRSIDWGGIGSTIMDLLDSAVSALPSLWTAFDTWFRGMLDSIDFGGAGNTVGEKVRSALITAFNSIVSFISSYGPTIGMALLALMIALPAFLGYLGALLIPKAIEFLQGFIEGLDIKWGEVGSWLMDVGSRALNAIGDLLQWLIPKGKELLAGLWQGIVEYAPQVWEWLKGVGALALAAIGSLLEWLIPKGKELLAGLWQGIVEYAPQVWEWLKSVGSLALTAVGNLLEWLIPKGKELLAGLWQGIVEYAPTVWAWLGTLGALAVAAIGSLLEWLIPKGKELLAGLWQGIVEYAPQVWSWLGQIGSLAVNAIGDLLSWLIPKGKELLAGLWQGIVEYAPQVWSWLGTVGSLAVSAVGDLLGYLLEKGKQLIAGLWQGAVGYWPSVTSWLAGLPSAAVGAVGDMAKALYDKGASLIQGLWDGAKDKWDDFVAWASGLNPMNIFDGGSGQSDASARWNDHQPWGGNPVGEGYRGPTQGIGNIQNIGGGGGNYDATGINAATAALNAYSPAASVASAASAAFGAALSAASTFATSLSTTVSAVGVTLTSLATGFIATGTLIGSAVMTWGTSLTTFSTSVATTSATVGAQLTALATGFIATGALIAAAIVTWTTPLTTFSSAAASNSSAVGASLTALATGFIATGALIASALNTAKSNVASFVSSASSSFSQFGSALNQASSNANSFRSAVSSAMSGVVSAVSSGMSSASNAVRSGASQWPSIIAATGGSMAAAGQAAGAQAGAGVAAGLYSMLGAVAAAANAIAAQVERALAAKLKIASPSKVTTYMGEMIGAGLVRGMNASVGDVFSASNGLAIAATPNVGYGRGGGGTLPLASDNRQYTYNVTIDAKDLKEYESAIAFFQDLSSSQAIM